MAVGDAESSRYLRLVARFSDARSAPEKDHGPRPYGLAYDLRKIPANSEDPRLAFVWPRSYQPPAFARRETRNGALTAVCIALGRPVRNGNTSGRVSTSWFPWSDTDRHSINVRSTRTRLFDVRRALRRRCPTEANSWELRFISARGDARPCRRMSSFDRRASEVIRNVGGSGS